MKIAYFVLCAVIGLLLMAAVFTIAVVIAGLFDKYLSDYKISKIIWTVCKVIFYLMGGIIIVMSCYRCGDIIISYFR